jgi:hypothetical protein
MPSLLRIAGFALAVVLVSLAVARLRHAGTGSRVPLYGLLLVGLGLGAIAVFPDLVRPIQGVLGLSGEPLGRLVTVLVVTVALGYLLVFYALARADRVNQRLSRLVRAMSAAQLETSRLAGGRLGGVLVCIPAYEEAANLPAVLAEIPSVVGGLFTEDQFHNPELLLGAARAGLRVLDVPVTIRKRTSGKSKKGTNLRYGLGFLRVIFKTWLW